MIPSVAYQERLAEIIDSKREKLIGLSDDIWELCETKFEEYQSAERLCLALEEEGFEVVRNAGGVATAFTGTFGSGGPTIALLGEYDALPGLSQKAGVADKEPLQPGGSGHGCGHNLLGVGALAAAFAVKHYLEEQRIQATVRYYGCPAEEGGGGKAYMVRAGLFDDVDIALTWHPMDENKANHATMLATAQIYFQFKGVSSHAGAKPHLGRSALDAVELMNVGANYVREHIIPEARVHYAITNTGGFAPNIVPSEAEVLYKVRAPETGQVKELIERITNIAKGAALMTGTEMELQFDGSSAELIPNSALAALLAENFKKIGTEQYTQEEIDFARTIQASFTEQQMDVVRRNQNKAISNDVTPFSTTLGFMPGSTDVGDVSWKVPTGKIYATTCAYGTPFHSWQLVTQGKSSIAHKGMLLAGKVLAATAVDLIEQPDLIIEAKREFREQLNGKQYESLIPADAKPSPVRKA
ncbi:M20 family metallopeptidase [Halalkalibacter oceani]|uniref:M20 family metallopeptidase n=1 Tax=Halalkalibacter oceani TaxID=1653776 RepID=A0A9X2DP19_9BACI|nr:M20 family metallopeptidase [Halalkalibacter oceani]MCM3712812.1 M20 family metallopeptidase [Halalkalibacter oceani]